MVEMMKERTEVQASRSASSATSSTTIPKTEAEVKQKLQNMESNFRTLERIKGLDAQINEVEVSHFIRYEYHVMKIRDTDTNRETHFIMHLSYLILQYRNKYVS